MIENIKISEEKTLSLISGDSSLSQQELIEFASTRSLAICEAIASKYSPYNLELASFLLKEWRNDAELAPLLIKFLLNSTHRIDFNVLGPLFKGGGEIKHFIKPVFDNPLFDNDSWIALASMRIDNMEIVDRLEDKIPALTSEDLGTLSGSRVSEIIEFLCRSDKISDSIRLTILNSLRLDFIEGVTAAGVYPPHLGENYWREYVEANMSPPDEAGLVLKDEYMVTKLAVLLSGNLPESYVREFISKYNVEDLMVELVTSEKIAVNNDFLESLYPNPRGLPLAMIVRISELENSVK